MFFASSKSRQRAKIRNMDDTMTSDHIQINIMVQNPSQEPPVSSKAKNQDFKDIEFLCTFKSRKRAKIQIRGVSRPVTISNPRSRSKTPVRNLQHPPKPPNRSQRTWVFFSSSKSRQRTKLQSVGLSKTSEHIKIKIKIQIPSQESRLRCQTSF